MGVCGAICTHPIFFKEFAAKEKLEIVIGAAPPPFGFFAGGFPRPARAGRKRFALSLLRRKVSLAGQKEDFGRTGKNWNEPLRSWILDIQKAEKLSRSDSFGEIKAFVQKIGTNHQLLDKSASFSFIAPWDFLAQFLASRASGRGEHSLLSPAKNLKSFELWEILKLARTYFKER